MAKRLEGKVAIITGAAQGQGAHEAKAFVAEGAKVMITDVKAEVLDLAKSLGDDARAMIHDVSDEDQWQAVVAAAIEAFGKIDILVNNAGIFSPGPVTETSKATFVAHFNVNQLGTFLGIKAVVPAMKDNGGGSIVNISSGAGQRGYPDMVAYQGTKWAVTGMTKGLARELAPFGIRVNSIHPGLIETPMIAGPEGKADFMVEIAKTVPLGRTGTTDDVVEPVIYLASDMSGYVTGSEMTMDGGTGL
ncbi:SDR family NAD(P)-dependent oxidoreductase [Novosphingobium colocasiae]|uniref:SDR family NAD(P)-dependent oxidoreductase n=1 Tax=Novosphingobium colocasiae TaxID=1256513 RepID=UPI0035B03A59